MFKSVFQKFEHQPIAMLLALMVFVLLVTVSGWRTYSNYSSPSREFDWGNRGLSDFNNGTYYPSMAFREGVIPYGVEAEIKYPLARAAPPYHPFHFMLHAPLTFINAKTAGAIFFVYSLGLVLLLVMAAIHCAGGRCSWFAMFSLSSFVLLSRPGHVTIFTGYFTLELVLGTVLAIAFANKRPWLSGVGLLLAAGKPTYVLPLMLLMACRRNWNSLIWGVSLCVAFGLAGLLWLASFSDLSSVVNGIVEGQQALQQDVNELPINTWTRTDLVGMVAKVFDFRPGDLAYLGWMLVLLAIPGYWLWRDSTREMTAKQPLNNSPPDQALFDTGGFVIVLAMLLSIYHHSYDCLLLFVPWAGLVFFGTFDRVMSFRRQTLIGLALLVVWLNYGSTRSVRGLLGLEQLSFVWQAITLINGVCILIALVLILTNTRPAAQVTNQD